MFTRLYIHIPFCVRKCPYCAFFSREHAGGDDREHYAGLLQQEMSLAAQNGPPPQQLNSIYFGGGTPSLMDPRLIARLIERAGHFFGITEQTEITLEANPGTVDHGRLADLRRAGINRLSLGVQSFDDRMLAALGRIHTAEQAQQAFGAARQAGFGNIGIDLINALPGQTMEMWRSDLRQALQLAPEHISVYGLTIEEDTPFDNKYSADSPLLPDQELAAAMFEAADDLLTTGGYEHYEIANYARSGFRSQHNSGYWKRDTYLGLGAGAHSCLGDTEYGTRFSNTADLDSYAEALRKGSLPRTDRQQLSLQDAMEEFMFLGLRMSDGVSFSSFRQTFGKELKQVFGQALVTSLGQGLMTEDAAGIRLTRRGRLLSNHVFRQFLD